MTAPFSLWVYLSTTPLLWLTVTLLAWLAADALARLSKRNPLVNPVLIAVIFVAALLMLTGTDYKVYFNGAQFVHFLLGPATVALAVPLYRNWPLVRRYLLPMAAALLVGSATALASTLTIALAFGLPRDILASLAPKSVTAAVAMAISEQLGGVPALTAVLVISTGIIGAVMVTPLMNAMRIRNFAARGFAVGLVSHGIGTARAFAVDSVAGTFSGIAMGLNAVMTALIAPIFLLLM
ncbi:LrgB family protein [Methylocella silvestris BL2]|uniref:LrgB family protein n=1 Tax=Methylocella silvestris (strain DSM 15510 / CIP 108128 / LMG 27833 / NCIMB 13906 / BL2) TaxID=395965 RepID=B8EIU7_METSB|nr:LrgB family protein [Methylocella silvestris]ACK51914.1 LrgB family protein [Methylocella silvestris BL2]